MEESVDATDRLGEVDSFFILFLPSLNCARGLTDKKTSVGHSSCEKKQKKDEESHGG